MVSFKYNDLKLYGISIIHCIGDLIYEIKIFKLLFYKRYILLNEICYY
jgi:hypothetical protein